MDQISVAFLQERSNIGFLIPFFVVILRPGNRLSDLQQWQPRVAKVRHHAIVD
jgi:hypothetical protein